MVTMMIKTALMVSLLFASLIAHATDDKNTAAKAQLRQVQQEKHKLEQDKAQLEQDKAALDAQLKAAQDSLASEKKSADGASHKNSTLQTQLDQANADKADLASKLADAQNKIAETNRKLTAVLAEKQALELAKAQTETDLGKKDQSLASCVAKNQEEYQYGVELLDKYEKKSCLTSMLQREPFFGITRTRIENEVAEFKEKLDKQHLPVSPTVAVGSGVSP